MPDPVMPPIAPIQRTEIDGVPTMWIDEPGPTVAALSFRVGRSDEPTFMGGISHIVEHLALAGLGVQDYDHNGFVDNQQTAFTTVGRTDEVKAFIEAVVHGLNDLPFDRLLMERRILREERAQRGPSIGGALRWYRFGYAGQGRGLGPGDDELGLEWLGQEPVQAWARRWFTRQNAMLWLTGPIPAGLRLDLPDGEAPTSPTVETTPGVAFPSHMAWDGPGATIGMTGTRSSVLNIVSNIAHRRARQRLRFDQGLVYDIQLDYEAITPSVAHITIGAESPDERIRTVLDGLLDVLRGLASDGPTAQELEQEMTSFVRQYEDRDGRIGFLAVTAWDTLWGGPTFAPAELLAERMRVDQASAAAAMASALESMLVLANCEPVEGLNPYPSWSPSRVEGREHGPSGFFLPGRKPKERLIVGPTGTTIAIGPAECLTVRYDDCVACVHEAPSVRTLLGRDGIRVTVVAEGWKDGSRIIEEIDRSIPPGLVACAEHGVGALDDPEADHQGTAAEP